MNSIQQRRQLSRDQRRSIIKEKGLEFNKEYIEKARANAKARTNKKLMGSIMDELSEMKEHIYKQGEEIKKQGEHIIKQGDEINNLTKALSEKETSVAKESTDNPEEELEQQEIGKRIRFVLENDWVKELLVTRFDNKSHLNGFKCDLYRRFILDYNNNFIYKNNKWYLIFDWSKLAPHTKLKVKEFIIHFSNNGELYVITDYTDGTELRTIALWYTTNICQIYNINFHIGCGQQLLHYKKNIHKFAINYIHKFVISDKFQ